MSEGWRVVLTEWNRAWSVVLGSALILGGYLASIGPLSPRFPGSAQVEPRRRWFVLGVLVIFLALVTPLDALSDDYLLSAHMVQHILITLVGPPLMILGTPGWLLRPLLRWRWLARLARILTNPVVAFTLFNSVFLVWHVPALYEGALENETVHAIAHLTFMVTAVMAWWPILSPMDELPRLSYPGQVLFLFLQSFPCTLLSALITFSPAPLYARYTQAPRIFGISVMSDQAIGGLIMWMPGGMIYLLALSIVFVQWIRRDEQPYDSSLV